MSFADCERWAALSDREATGGALSPEEGAFLRTHGAACATCGAEQALWSALAKAPAGRGEAPSSVADRVLERLHSETRAAAEAAGDGPRRGAEAPAGAARPAAGRRRVVALGLGVATLAAAAAVVLAVGRPRQGSLASAPPVALQGGVAKGGVALAAPGAAAEGDLLTARDGPACFAIEGGVTLCLDGGARARVVDGALAHRRVEALRGRVVASLRKQAPGTSFTVSARGGSVTAVGTAFTVEVPESGPVVARVLHGTVLVRAEGRPDQRVSAHRGVVLGEEARPIAQGDEARDWAIVPPLQHLVDEVPDAVSAAPRGAEGTGASSASALPAAPEPQRAVRPTKPRDEGRTAPVSAPSTPAVGAPRDALLERSFDAVSEGAARDARGATAAPTAAPTSPADLLRRARDRRAAGDFAAAAALYRELTLGYPRAFEARAALVALGQVELYDLHDAAAALAAFDAYLVQGGVLEQEARKGREQALRALGPSGAVPVDR